jgi:DNA helicase-2/ATP-dependent DNA helicase PcrA
MVEKRLTLEPEVKEILALIDKGENFLLSGGAGSGKTYSLVQVIRQILVEHPVSRVACMTYTNAAVKEIEERVNHPNLNVTTIHDFLWDQIKNFKKELKEALISLTNDEAVSKISIKDVHPVPPDFFDTALVTIQYKEYLRIKDGIISHDELLIVANYMFKKYRKLSDIVKDKFKFIFVDEYQDTSQTVVEILLTHFKQSKRRNIIGFFGDAMQSIYDEGIGNLNEYKGDEGGLVKEVRKIHNRRNPQKVITLANKLRTDGIEQEPSKDSKAPNMLNGIVKPGNVLFIYSEQSDLAPVQQYLTAKQGWDFKNTKETKELNLTHNLIAGKAGFKTLMDIYDGDRIIEYRNRVRDYIKSKNIETDFSEMTFGQVIEKLSQGKTVRELQAIRPTDSMQSFIDSHQDLYKTALSYNYTLFNKIFVNKDQLIDDKKQDQEEESKKGSKRDNLIKHLFKLENSISLYTNRQYNEFLRVTDYTGRLLRIEDKKKLKENIDSLIHVGDKTIEEVILDAHEKFITVIDDRLDEFRVKRQYVYDRVKAVKFSEFQQLYNYLEGKTPFSTQHKTKGTEFDNVLVVLDNGNWNYYNFENLFLQSGKQTVLERTQKIFYVCCTRTKENLAVFYYNPTQQVIDKAGEWFGNENVIKI